MNCVAFITNDTNLLLKEEMVSKLSMEQVLDIFEIPQAISDSGKHQGNITIHYYRHTNIQDDRFTEVMRDVLAVHPNKCYLHTHNKFCNKAYNVCKTYGLPVEYILSNH